MVVKPVRLAVAFIGVSDLSSFKSLYFMPLVFLFDEAFLSLTTTGNRKPVLKPVVSISISRSISIQRRQNNLR